MKQNFASRPGIWASLLAAASVASAQTALADDNSLFQRNDEDETQLNRFGVSYSMGIHMTAHFEGLGQFNAASNPGAVQGVGNRLYDNGYVYVDSSGDRGGQTWNWGYANQNQVQTSGGATTLAMTSTSGSPTASADINGDPQEGFELTYNRELGHKGGWHWGVEVAGGWTDLTFRDASPLPGNTSVLTDVFAVSPVVPFTAPRNWPFNPGSAAPGGASWKGPAALIGDQPLNPYPSDVSTVAGGSTITGYRDLTADLFSFRLGPYLQVPLIRKKLNLSLGGGLALMEIFSAFDYTQTVTVPGLAPQSSSGGGSQRELLVGGYVEGSLQYKIDHHWDVMAGVQWRRFGTFDHFQDGVLAVMDFDDPFFVNVGVGYNW